MTENSLDWQQVNDRAGEEALKERQRVIGEIVLLLPVVARRPGSMKLLQGILNQCRAFSQYKTNRSYQR